MYRGQVYWYKFKDFSAHPVLIIQNNKGNAHSDWVIVVEISSSKTVKNKKIPTIVSIYRENYSNYFDYDLIKEEAFALCSNIYTIKKEELGNYFGTLDLETMERIDRAIKISLGLEG